jgi:hypothetical protein
MKKHPKEAEGDADKLSDLVGDWEKYPEVSGPMGPWIKALITADNKRDVKPLVALLRDQSIKVLPDARLHLADFLERKFRGTKGRARTPSYTFSPKEIDVISAYIDMLCHMHFMGDTVEEAIERVVKKHKHPVSFEDLERMHQTTHTQFQIELKRKSSGP